MPEFGENSLNNLKSCHVDIVRVCSEVVRSFDCSVLCGYRGASVQMLGFRTGKSKLVYPLSKHNPNYDKEGLRRLAHILKCGSSLKAITEAIKHVDDDILCAIDESADITYKSYAVDIVPYPVDWRYKSELYGATIDRNLSDIDEIFLNVGRWHEFAGRMLGVADSMGIKLQWGGHWKSFKDLPHFQLLGKGD